MRRSIELGYGVEPKGVPLRSLWVWGVQLAAGSLHKKDPGVDGGNMSKRTAGQAFDLGFQRRTMRRGGARKVAHFATTTPVVQTGTRGRGVAGFQRTAGFYGRYGALAGATAELKFHDVDADQGTADLSGGVIVNTSSINLIPQNVTEKGRVGRKCTIKSINWRGNLNQTLIAAAALRDDSEVRLMVVLDKQCNGAAPTVTGVLETGDIHSFNNLANKGRFRTLSDQTFRLSANSAAGNGTANDAPAVVMPFSWFKNCNIPIEFDAATGAITEIRSNNLFILMIASVAGSVISLDSKIRLRFTDS